ncbi:MAG: DNA glycosylase [Verrucomicrobiota bacterium]
MPAGICGSVQTPYQKLWPVCHYDLAGTLSSGQAFRWRPQKGSWEGVLRNRWARLTQLPEGIQAETLEEVPSWTWLEDYLQIHVNLDDVLLAFPADEPMRRAVQACRGLRLLRQDPWECLASFILSSTKQIVQIQQIIGLLCERFGQPVAVPAGNSRQFSFPTAQVLSQVPESDLRLCKMGFRAPYLRSAATAVAAGHLDLERLGGLSSSKARQSLVELPGVGEKIANCVLLFAYGFQEAFPVDVWVTKALRQLYFPKRRVDPRRLSRFTQTYFGPYSGYAQQYLFHYMRTEVGRAFRGRQN